jgi:hypothetical protein
LLLKNRAQAATRRREMKTFRRALVIGVLVSTFAGCEFDAAPRDTINVQVAQDGGVPDALPNPDGALHCHSFKLGVACIPGGEATPPSSGSGAPTSGGQ